MSDQPCFWKSRARELEAQVCRLQGENEVLRRQLAVHPLPRSPRPPQRPGEITFLFEAPRVQPQSQPARKTKIDSLLGATPRTEDEWLERRNHLRLSDEISVVNTFLQFISYIGSPITSSVRIRDEGSSTAALLRRYRQFTQYLRQDSDRTGQITNFGILLLICLCRIARTTKKMSVLAVDDCMNDFLPQGKKVKGRDYLRRLRNAACWPARQAEALRPWLGNRADEFFLLCKTLVNVVPSFAS